MKKTICKLLAVLMILPMMICFASCNKNEGDATKISFKSAAGYDYLKTLNEKKVTISGYMATSSPVDGSFMFLLNLPYQNCPFCKPNTSQLSNTMEVYPKEGEKFEYTTQAIKVIGTLLVAEKEDEPFTDKYGYEFNYKIVDARYESIDPNELPKEMALWQEIASTDVVSDIYAMYDYVNFVCAWPTYFVDNRYDENGQLIPGYYLYPTDAEKFIKTDGAQWNYGYKKGYFDSIINKIKSVDPNAFGDLIMNIEKAKALAEKALKELEDGKYSYEEKYVDKFQRTDYVYKLDKEKELTDEMLKIFSEFTDWIGSWEM